MSSQVGGGEVGSAEGVEAGKIDAAVVTYETIPGEVDVADRRSGPVPPTGGADGQHEIGSTPKAGSGVIKRDLCRKGRCRRANAVDAGARVGAVGDQNNVDTRMICDSETNGQRRSPVRWRCGCCAEGGPKRRSLGLHGHHDHDQWLLRH